MCKDQTVFVIAKWLLSASCGVSLPARLLLVNCDILDDHSRDKACDNASHDSLNMCTWGRVGLQTYHIQP